MLNYSELIKKNPHWHHKFEIAPGVFTPGSFDPEALLAMLQLPRRLDGLRVLDIGTSDGFFALEMWRRGAEVVALDYRDKKEHGYWVTEAISGMQVSYVKCSLYEIDASSLGTFDIVLFLGVLYHLPDMMRGLDLVRSVTKTRMFLETYCDFSLPQDIACARYYKHSSLSNDFSNFWAPNSRCVKDMLDDVGFEVEREQAWGDRIFLSCSRSISTAQSSDKLSLAYKGPGFKL